MTVDGVVYPDNMEGIRGKLMDARLTLDKQMEVVEQLTYQCVDVGLAAELDEYLQQLIEAVKRRALRSQEMKQYKKMISGKSQHNRYWASREGKEREMTEYPRVVLKVGLPTAEMMREAERLAKGALDRGLFRYDCSPREIATMLGFHPTEQPLTRRPVWQQEPWKLAAFLQELYRKLGGSGTFRSYRNLCYVVHEAVEITGAGVSEETLRTARLPKGLTGDPFSGLFG